MIRAIVRRSVFVVCISSVMGACASNDGREMAPPRPDQSASISPDTTSGQVVGQPIGTMTLTGPWSENGPIDARYTCDGPGLTAPLAWTPGPEGTASYVVLMTDLDEPEYIHWVVANISAAITSLVEDSVPAGAVSGMNDAEVNGYAPPCPKAGETHRFVVSVYALNAMLPVNEGDDATAMIDAIEAATLTVASTYFSASR